MLCWKIAKIHQKYVFSTYFYTGKYGPCSEKYGPCTGVRVEYVQSTYLVRTLEIILKFHKFHDCVQKQQ